MMSDVEMARIYERGGWRWWMVRAALFIDDVWQQCPTIIRRGKLDGLRNKADGYDTAVEAWEKRGIEIGRLRSVVRVNGLRWGHTHKEIDEILDPPNDYSHL